MSSSKTATQPHPTCHICCDHRASHGACANCAIEVCRACARRCALDDESSVVPSCPSCGRVWEDAEEQRRRLGAAFVTGPYRVARRRRLVARERARLAASAPAAAHERERRRLTSEMRATVERIRQGEHHLVHRYQTLHAALNALQRPSETSARAVRCAHGDCLGFVDAHHGACAACERLTCPRCGEAIRTMGDDGEELPPHQCDAAVLQSRQAIAAQCKPCASCGAPSVRSEGCAVMWCAHCRAFWNWDTGRVIDTRRGAPPHNPDHRAWVAAGSVAREVGDVPCGGIPEPHAMHEALVREFARTMAVHETTPVVVAAFEAVRVAQRLRHSHPITWDDADAHEELRMALLLGDVTNEGFADKLERADRSMRLKRDVGRVLEMYVLASTDVLQRFVSYDDCATAARELVCVCEWADAALASVSTAHGGRKVPRLALSTLQWVLPNRRLTT